MKNALTRIVGPDFFFDPDNPVMIDIKLRIYTEREDFVEYIFNSIKKVETDEE